MKPDSETEGSTGVRADWRPTGLSKAQRTIVDRLAVELSNVLECRHELLQQLGSDPDATLRRLAPHEEREEEDAQREGDDAPEATETRSMMEVLEAFADAEDVTPAINWTTLNAIDHSLLRLRKYLESELAFLDGIYQSLLADVAISEVAELLRDFQDARGTWSACDPTKVARVSSLLGLNDVDLRKVVENDEVSEVRRSPDPC